MFKNFSPTALGVTGHQSELIELALTYGFSGMDLDASELVSRARLKGMDYARRLIDSAKIKLGAFPLSVDLEADDAQFVEGVKRLGEAAAAAAEVGCRRCVATLAPFSATRPYHENFEFHRQRLGAICEALRPSGARLGLGFQAAEYLRRNQPFQFIHDFDALGLLINMVGASNIGFLVDPWDLVVSGLGLDALAKLPVEQIVAVQLAGLPQDKPLPDLDQNSRLVPDVGGRIDLAAVLRILAEKHYDGPVTPRPSRGAVPSRRREAIVRQVAEGIDRVWRAAGLPCERRVFSAAAVPAAAAAPPAEES